MPEVLIEMHIKAAMIFIANAKTIAIYNDENNPSAQAYKQLSNIQQTLVHKLLNTFTLTEAQSLGFIEIVELLVNSGQMVEFRCQKIKHKDDVAFKHSNPKEKQTIFKTHDRTYYETTELFKRVLNTNGIFSITVAKHYSLGIIVDKVSY